MEPSAAGIESWSWNVVVPITRVGVLQSAVGTITVGAIATGKADVGRLIEVGETIMETACRGCNCMVCRITRPNRMPNTNSSIAINRLTSMILVLSETEKVCPELTGGLIGEYL